jgi:hypothetical protein
MAGGASGMLDLSGDGAVTVVDGLGWVIALSAIGLAVLLTAGAVFAALLWTVKGVAVTLAAVGRGVRAAVIAAVDACRWARSAHRLQAQARSHQASSSP